MEYSADPALKIRKLFITRLSMGMPAMIFTMLVVSVVSVFMLTTLLITLLWAVFIFTLMYFIHRKDPQALTFWIHALRRPYRWSAGAHPKRTVYVVDEFGNNFFIPYGKFTRVNSLGDSSEK